MKHLNSNKTYYIVDGKIHEIDEDKTLGHYIIRFMAFAVFASVIAMLIATLISNYITQHITIKGEQNEYLQNAKDH